MKPRISRRVILMIAAIFLLGIGLTSCNSKSSGSQTMYLAESSSGSGCSASTSATKSEWLDSKEKDVITSKEDALKSICFYYLRETGKTEVTEPYLAKFNEIIENIKNGETKAEILQLAEAGKVDLLEITSTQTIVNANFTLEENGPEVVTKFDSIYTKEFSQQIYKNFGLYLINNYIQYSVVAGDANKEKTEEDWLKNYKCANIHNDAQVFITYINQATTSWKDDLTEDQQSELSSVLAGSSGSSCITSNYAEQKASLLKKVSESQNVYEIVVGFIVKAEERLTETEPLVFHAASFGDFMANFFGNIFVFPVGWLLYIISKLMGGYYIIGLIITTLFVRTLGWPIYAKSNDMTMKMSMMTPDINAIQEKYATRKDPESQRMMQMEQAQLYKKYGVGIGGCIMPFLQFPIFLAIYNAVQRLPYTKAIANTIYKYDWANKVKSNFFGINLFDDRTGGKEPYQLIGVIVLIVLVVGTQFLANWISQVQQKKTQQKSQEDIPAYRRQAFNQTKNDAGSSMKIMMYVMMLMMGVFVWSSKAGLGIYWLIGNLYSIVQMIINNKTSAKRMAKLKSKQRN